ncbi:hypothetical protein GGX14DRAFT_563791 [Mycena pura]|uniref:Uncharacterized protein n=1 Tax=Mycena pura TaxID=153505 RepID=A0AAD6VHW2_9AGAR|nr:hypothetical protein GGX14DRAFT_563791 [Mycena pura]
MACSEPAKLSVRPASDGALARCFRGPWPGRAAITGRCEQWRVTARTGFWPTGWILPAASCTSFGLRASALLLGSRDTADLSDQLSHIQARANLNNSYIQCNNWNWATLRRPSPLIVLHRHGPITPSHGIDVHVVVAVAVRPRLRALEVGGDECAPCTSALISVRLTCDSSMSPPRNRYQRTLNATAPLVSMSIFVRSGSIELRNALITAAGTEVAIASSCSWPRRSQLPCWPTLRHGQLRALCASAAADDKQSRSPPRTALFGALDRPPSTIATLHTSAPARVILGHDHVPVPRP